LSSNSHTGSVGFIVNPASGKDIRRLVAKASVFDNQEKRAIIRRAISGVCATGVNEFYYVPDTNEIARSAVTELTEQVSAHAVACPGTRSALDSKIGAIGLKEAGCDVVITLGGDGTNRAVVSGWRHAPLIPISTGTNNAFPVMVEATVAGAAAGLVASGKVPLETVAEQAKLVHIEIENEEDDLALIDAVLTNDRFVGARALLDSDRLQIAMLTRASAEAVGIAAIGGFIQQLSNGDDNGLCLRFSGQGSTGEGRRFRVPIAPGLYQVVAVESAKITQLGECITERGPGVLALDVERDRVLKPGQQATMKVIRDGPWVIDVARTLQSGARNGAFEIFDTGDTGEI
jgi:hypothetical protein